MNILWASPHRQLQAQSEELHRLFGDYEFTSLSEWRSVNELLSVFLALPEPRELVLVAPLAICREVLKRGVRPLSPRMERIRPDGINSWDAVTSDGRAVFVGFRRRTGISETFEEVVPRQFTDEEIAEEVARA